MFLTWKNKQCSSIQRLPDIRYNTAVKVRRLRPLVLLIRVASRKKMGMEHWWNDTDRGKLKSWERNIT